MSNTATEVRERNPIAEVRLWQAAIVKVIRRWISGPLGKRFPIGTRVQVKNVAMNGVVLQSDDSPTALGEYLHGIQTKHGELREPGCNLEPIPELKT
jgi:hypothetical protein